MGFTMDDKVVEIAATTPQVFVNASLGEGDEYNREPGIQLTKEQIISLRKYEVFGLRLPTRLADVIKYLDYGSGDSGGNGLTAMDFQRTFTMTYDHAYRWSPLREKIMLTGNDLKIFGGSIIRIGAGIVEIYEDLKSSKYLEQHDIKTQEEYLELKRRIPGLPDLDSVEGDIPEIKYYLNDMLVKVRQCHDKAQGVRNEIDSFGTDMRAKVLQEIALRLKHVSENTYRDDIQVLQKDIDRRAAEIDELNKQYDQLVQEAIKAAAAFNIGGLILGIYQGVKAENLRKERNQLNDAQKIANQVMAGKSKTLNSLNRVRDDLQNLSYVAIEAEVATQNLMLVWNKLTDFITASMNNVNELDNAISLRTYVKKITMIVDPWKKIETKSDQLLAVFAEADKEYTQEGITGMRSMYLVSGNSGFPQFSVAKLREYNGVVQKGNTTAQMLFERFNYVSGAVGTINSLALAISKLTFDVRDVSQSTSIGLERTKRSIELSQADLGDPEYVEEVRAELEEELKNAFRKLTEQTEGLKSIHRSISTPYDRGASKQWVEQLQLDRASDEQLKVNVEDKLNALNEKMKSVYQAIDLIGKAGIEKIGEEAKLSLESFKALGLAPPQIAVALLAIDTLKKMISGIGDAISYLNMLAGYNRLKEQAGELRTQVEKYTKAIAKIEGRIELVKTLDQLDEQRWDYVGEFSNLVADFEKIADDFKQDKSIPVEERADAAIARIPGVIKYLNSVTR